MSDNEENCDYTLNQILHAALLSRGYTVREEEGKLLPAFKIPVAFDTLAYINSRNNGSTCSTKRMATSAAASKKPSARIGTILKKAH